MEDEEKVNELTACKKVVKFGTGLAVLIPNDLVKALEIKLGDLVEVTFKKTGHKAPIDPRAKNGTNTNI